MKPFKYRLQRMPELCGGITLGGKYDCIDPIVGGVVQRLILINKKDWDQAIITYDIENANLITDVDLGEEVGYEFEGARKSITPQSAFTPSAVTVGYDHQVEFLIFDISSAQKTNIEEMALSQGTVAIVQNTNAEGNDDSIFEVLGKDVGMQVQAGPMRINGDIDTNGAYTINLKTSDDQGKEPHLPASWWDTDFATTKLAVDALLTPTPA